MIGLIIYIVGIIVAYPMLRKDLRNEFGEDYSWTAVFMTLVFSFFSWVSVFAMLFALFNDTNKKPPKWL